MLPWRRKGSQDDAEQDAPYLTHTVRHHGVYTLTPGDNMGRRRKEEEPKRKEPRRRRGAVDPSIVDAVLNVGLTGSTDELEHESIMSAAPARPAKPAMAHATHALLRQQAAAKPSRPVLRHLASSASSTGASAAARPPAVRPEPARSAGVLSKAARKKLSAKTAASGPAVSAARGPPEPHSRSASSQGSVQTPGERLLGPEPGAEPPSSDCEDLSENLSSDGPSDGTQDGVYTPIIYAPPRIPGRVYSASAPHASHAAHAAGLLRGIEGSPSYDVGARETLSSRTHPHETPSSDPARAVWTGGPPTDTPTNATEAPAGVLRTPAVLRARSTDTEASGELPGATRSQPRGSGPQGVGEFAESGGEETTPVAVRLPAYSAERVGRGGEGLRLDRAGGAEAEEAEEADGWGASSATDPLHDPAPSTPPTPATPYDASTRDILALSIDSLLPPPAYEPPSPTTRARMDIPYETRSRAASNASAFTLPPSAGTQTSFGNLGSVGAGGGSDAESDAALAADEAAFMHAWEEDRAAGLSLDARIERDLARRMAATSGDVGAEEPRAEEEQADIVAQRLELAAAEAAADVPRLARALSVYGERRLARRVSVLPPGRGRSRILAAPSGLAALAAESGDSGESGESASEESESESEIARPAQAVNRQKMIEAAERRLQGGLNQGAGEADGRAETATDNAACGQNDVQNDVQNSVQTDDSPHISRFVEKGNTPLVLSSTAAGKTSYKAEWSGSDGPSRTPSPPQTASMPSSIAGDFTPFDEGDDVEEGTLPRAGVFSPAAIPDAIPATIPAVIPATMPFSPERSPLKDSAVKHVELESPTTSLLSTPTNPKIPEIVGQIGARDRIILRSDIPPAFSRPNESDSRSGLDYTPRRMDDVKDSPSPPVWPAVAKDSATHESRRTPVIPDEIRRVPLVPDETRHETERMPSIPERRDTLTRRQDTSVQIAQHVDPFSRPSRRAYSNDSVPSPGPESVGPEHTVRHTGLPHSPAMFSLNHVQRAPPPRPPRPPELTPYTGTLDSVGEAPKILRGPGIGLGSAADRNYVVDRSIAAPGPAYPAAAPVPASPRRPLPQVPTAVPHPTPPQETAVYPGSRPLSSVPSRMSPVSPVSSAFEPETQNALYSRLTRSNSIILQGAGRESRHRRRQGSMASLGEGTESPRKSQEDVVAASPLRTGAVVRPQAEPVRYTLAESVIDSASAVAYPLPRQNAGPTPIAEETSSMATDLPRTGHQNPSHTFTHTQAAVTAANSRQTHYNAPQQLTDTALVRHNHDHIPSISRSHTGATFFAEEDEDEVQETSPVTAPTPSTHVQASMPQYTELDLLVARLNDPETRAEANYEEYLLLSEILGGGGRTPGLTTDELGELSEAPVQLASTRVNSQGRRKVKLEVVGVRCVDCSICLSRFKPAENAIVLPRCLHVFHSNCLQTWLRQRRACPLCRKAVFEGDHRVNESTGRTESDY